MPAECGMKVSMSNHPHRAPVFRAHPAATRALLQRLVRERPSPLPDNDLTASLYEMAVMVGRMAIAVSKEGAGASFPTCWIPLLNPDYSSLLSGKECKNPVKVIESIHRGGH